MRYAGARWELYQRDEAYRIYVTDALKVVGHLNIRYIDYFKKTESRTGDEIIQDLKSGLARIGGDNGSV